LAEIVQFIPYVGEFLATAINLACTALRLKVTQEWISLQVLEGAMQATVQPRKIIENEVLPLIQLYADTASLNTALAAERTLKAVSDQNRVKGALYPAPLPAVFKLPIVKETEPKSQGDVPRSPNTASGIAVDVGNMLSMLDAAKAIRRAILFWM